MTQEYISQCPKKIYGVLRTCEVFQECIWCPKEIIRRICDIPSNILIPITLGIGSFNISNILLYNTTFQRLEPFQFYFHIRLHSKNHGHLQARSTKLVQKILIIRPRSQLRIGSYITNAHIQVSHKRSIFRIISSESQTLQKN